MTSAALWFWALWNAVITLAALTVLAYDNHHSDPDNHHHRKASSDDHY